MNTSLISAFADEIAPDLETQMNVLEQHGIKYIELRRADGKGVLEYTAEEARELKKRLDQRGFRISAVGSPIGKQKISDDFAPHLEQFKHALVLAEILETKYIRLFSFFIPKEEDPAPYRGEVMERTFQLVKAAEGTGIVLCHENEKGIFGQSAVNCVDLAQTMNSPQYRLIFDPANFVESGVETFPHAYELMKPYIEYMHIKDARKGAGVVPAGYGDGQVKEVLTDLYRSGFDNYLSIEPHLSKFKGFADLEPGSPELPEGNNVEKFGIAADALKKLLAEIG